MAAAAADVLGSGGHLVVQAGTGTGKSLAYLTAVAVSGKRTIVATATRALQDQLATRDLPFLAEHLPFPLTFAVLKGRSNYLCLQRLDELAATGAGEPRLDLDTGGGGGELDPSVLTALAEVTTTDTTGDRADLGIEVDDRIWRLVSTGADECPGAARCPRGEDCFAERARSRAADVDVCVVNLHLLALDLTLGGEVILPPRDAVVVDEAHQLEDVVASAAGRSLTPGRLRALARTAGGVLTGTEVVARLDGAADRLASVLTPLVGQRLGADADADLEAPLTAVRAAVDTCAHELRAVPESAPREVQGRVQRARQMCDGILVDTDALARTTDDEVRWVDGPSSNPALSTTPIDVGGLLATNLWDACPTICTSATIPVGFVDRLGLPAGTEVLDVGSPFDHGERAVLYCAAHLPDPRRPEAEEARIDELEELISAAGGRTLALFTSFAAMNRAADHLTTRLPWRLLRQGDASKAALLETFISDETSCLFATMSFWQGVDVPGPACILVTLDRLPFPRPDEPVLAARRDRAGRAAFRTIDLPRAATLLAQGAGRLLRRADDRGVVAVLDPRLATARSYRWDLVRALPPMGRTSDREEVLALLRSLRDDRPDPAG